MAGIGKTKRQKMRAGELYDAMDSDLVRERDRARDLRPGSECQSRVRSGNPSTDFLTAVRQGRRHRMDAAAFFLRLRFQCRARPPGLFQFQLHRARYLPCEDRNLHSLRPGVQILTPMHPLNAELRRKQEFGKPVSIGSDVWVGGGALILPGVRIGSRTIIGAGSVVTKDIPDDVFAAGNPCRVIRDVSEENQSMPRFTLPPKTK
jgi:maltose O-acetyltransferase